LNLKAPKRAAAARRRRDKADLERRLYVVNSRKAQWDSQIRADSNNA